MKTHQTHQKENMNDTEYHAHCRKHLQNKSIRSQSTQKLKNTIDPIALTSFIMSILSIPGISWSFIMTEYFKTKAYDFNIPSSRWPYLSTVFFNQPIFLALTFGILSLVFFHRFKLNHTGKKLAISGIVISTFVMLVMLLPIILSKVLYR